MKRVWLMFRLDDERFAFPVFSVPERDRDE